MINNYNVERQKTKCKNTFDEKFYKIYIIKCLRIGVTPKFRARVNEGF